MNADTKNMNAEQLRKLIAGAKARLKEVEPPGKRWDVRMRRTRTANELLAITVEATDEESVHEAALASEKFLNESKQWDTEGDEVTSFVVDEVLDLQEFGPCEFDGGPEYRVGLDGKLEEVE